MPTPSPVVLYVEDEESDRFFMQMAFASHGLESALRTVDHGQDALNYLSGVAHFADREKHPLPAVVLLDLHLPEVHGFDVLKWIRSHPVHRDLPVVIFSSSPLETDQLQARSLGANDFVPKPSSATFFGEIVRKLNAQWLGDAQAKKPQDK